MSPGRDEDLDWLYGRDGQQVQPERTRVMPNPYGNAAPDAPPGQAPYPRRAPAGRPRTAPPRPGSPRRPAARTWWVAGRWRHNRGRQRNDIRSELPGVVALVFVVWLIGVPAYAWTQVARVDAAPSGERPADQPGKTFLLVARTLAPDSARPSSGGLGTGSAGGQRTDTIMLVYVPPGGKSALISIPRDSYVDIPRHSKNKINAAYAYGGPELLVQTVEQNTGLRLDGYMEIGFGGFVNIIDALDGIRMCLPNAIKDRDSHLDLPKGCQTLSGTEALGYVRMRKADPRGDLGRVERRAGDAGGGGQEGRVPGDRAQSSPLLELLHRYGGGDQAWPRHLAA